MTPSGTQSAALGAIWERHRDLVLARLGAIEQAAEHEAGSEARAEGVHAAHQLAGTVGTFGFASATEMARELETRLGGTGSPTAELAALARELRRELAGEAGGGSDHTEPDRPQQTRVLAIDDDPLILDSLRALLAGRGLEVVTEVDPRRVVALLPEVAPDLVILDIDMPEMDGIELCRRVRADPDHRGLRIVFLTTHTDPETVQAAYDAGADGHLAKPVVVAELLAWMQRHPAKSASVTDR